SGGHALIADFGVAKAIAAAASMVEPESGHSGATMAGVALGTPAYMAPEQAVGDPRTDHRADLYALGIIAYELLAGAPPLRGNSVQDFVVAHVTETARPISQLRPDVPPALASLIAQLLAKDPRNRPQRAAEVIRVVDAIEPRRPWRRIVGAALAAGLLVALGVAFRSRFTASARATSAIDDERVVVTAFENQNGD